MQKLNNDRLELLQRVTKIAKMYGIESFSIEPKVIRGMADTGIVICHENDDEDFFLGVGRVSILKTRFDLMDSLGGSFKVNYDTRPGTDDIVQRLYFSSDNSRTKIEYTCCKPDMVKAPRKLTDELLSEFSLTEDTLSVLAKAATAMESQNLQLRYANEQLSVTLIDTQSDKLESIISEKVEASEIDEFSFTYNVKHFLSVIKDCPQKNNVNISRRGFLKSAYDGVTVFLAPVR